MAFRGNQRTCILEDTGWRAGNTTGLNKLRKIHLACLVSASDCLPSCNFFFFFLTVELSNWFILQKLQNTQSVQAIPPLSLTFWCINTVCGIFFSVSVTFKDNPDGSSSNFAPILWCQLYETSRECTYMI